MIYFAYGSNMCTARLRRRVASARPLGRAVLPGWRVGFRKRSVDGSAKCTIEPSSGDTVHGVAFEIDERELAALNATEGPGYEQVTVVVTIGDRPVDAATYVARPSWIDSRLEPYDWYLDLVLAGAVEHGLPTSYVDSALTVSAVSDPDSERAALNRAHLA